MTAQELRKLLNDEFGLGQWPNAYEVDHETYANVCQDIIEHKFNEDTLFWNTVEDGIREWDFKIISIAVGMNKGIMFKNVELILRSEGRDGRKRE